MAHNAFIHGGTAVPTAWLPGYVLTQLDFQSIDQLLFESINGDKGGTWAPAAAIVVGGAGLAVSTTFLMTGVGSASFYGGAVVISAAGGASFNGINVDFDPSTNVTFENGFDVLTGDVTIDAGSVAITLGNLTLAAGDLTLTAGDLTVTAGALLVGGPGEVDGDMVVSGTLTGLGLASFSSCTSGSFGIGSVFSATATTFGLSAAVTSTIAGPITISNTLTQAGNMSLTGLLTPSGSGRMAYRVYNLPDAAGITVGIADGTIFVIPALGTSRTYTLSTTGAVTGDVVTFTAYANTTVNIAGVGLWNLKNVTGEVVEVSFYFDGAAWLALSHSLVP